MILFWLQKMVVKLEINEDKEKTKAMNAVSRLSGLIPIFVIKFP